MKDKRELMAEAIDAWGNEDKDNRCIFVVFGDNKGDFTSCGYAGLEVDVVGAIVNEMLEDANVARIIDTASKVYKEVLKEEEKEKTNTPKHLS